jgi:DNA-binding beta-propeller fold protein YncE
MRRRATSFFSLRSLDSCLAAVAASCALFGCNLDNQGDPPPRGDIYMPAGLLLSAASEDQAPRVLYVVNSNFDLRYNMGSLQAFDLEAIDRRVGDCAANTAAGDGDDEEDPSEEGVLGAATCVIDPTDVLMDEVLVPSLATYVTAASDHSRMYVTTRTEANVAVVDLDESSERPLSCKDKDRVCDPTYTEWKDPGGRRVVLDTGEMALPQEPVGIAAGRAADFLPDSAAAIEGQLVMVAYRNGQVIAFLDQGGQLVLQDLVTLGGKDTPLREPTAIAFDPATRLAYVTIYARGLPSLSSKKILGRVGLASSGSADFPNSLYDAGAVSLEGVSLGLDTRGLAMNPLRPGEALVAANSPTSLLWVDLAGAETGASSPTQAFVKRATPVASGPTRVITGKLGERTIAIVSCFDARQIFIVDTATSEVLSVVHNFSGPFELGLDSARQRLYVADFRSSVVRILDLSPLVGGANETTATARIVATLGHPKLVQELQ